MKQTCKAFLFVSIFIFSASGWTADPPKSTPALIKKGKTIFKTRCVSCHGATNFATYTYKNGNSPEQIFKTIAAGFPPAMPPFDSLSEEDRWGTVYYVKSLKK
jgi:mono/diheme cytochrome c family protein